MMHICIYVLTYVLMSQDFTSLKKCKQKEKIQNHKKGIQKLRNIKVLILCTFTLSWASSARIYVLFWLSYFIFIQIFQLEKTTLCPCITLVKRDKSLTWNLLLISCQLIVKPIWNRFSFALLFIFALQIFIYFFCARKQQKYEILLIDEDFILDFLSVTMLMMKLLMVTMMMKCWRLWTFQEGTLLPFRHLIGELPSYNSMAMMKLLNMMMMMMMKWWLGQLSTFEGGLCRERSSLRWTSSVTQSWTIADRWDDNYADDEHLTIQSSGFPAFESKFEKNTSDNGGRKSFYWVTTRVLLWTKINQIYLSVGFSHWNKSLNLRLSEFSAHTT